jgi:predicted acylesterase/phospholipase RssA
MSTTTDAANAFLCGTLESFDTVNQLWRRLKSENEISLARLVLTRIRRDQGLLDELPPDRKIRAKLCQQHAELTSKDPELSANVRHDAALKILCEIFNLDDPLLDADVETLGIAGGICKRRWMDLGQYEDLQRAAAYYRRGVKGQVGDDGYAHINAVFMQDLLSRAAGGEIEARAEATALREKILTELTPLEKVKPDAQWWNAATRAEALFGLGRYKEAASAIEAVSQRPEPWQLEATAQQIGTLSHLREKRPSENPEIRAVFEALLPGAAHGARSAVIGKLGLALSGGGFRASFYHLGVLARLAELDVLRHINVLSCVSGGSIVAACYWLMLRNRLLERAPLEQIDYVTLIQDLIEHFKKAVAQDLRGLVQPSRLRAGWNFIRNARGAMDSEETAEALETYFYAPLWRDKNPLYMHHLPFTPCDHDPRLTGDQNFNPAKHNWLRRDKVPMLVLNATTVNTGHAWQFTPTWMGESPWSIHPAADSVPRLQWHWYDPGANWQIKLGQAVAASACVPMLFEPLRIDDAYDGYQIQLVDGGVQDNQGTVSLLAHNCNVIIVSDAAGQLLLERSPEPGLPGLGKYAIRIMDTLMERVRIANYADLAARVRTKLVRGLMFLHMKDGLDADIIRLKFSQESYDLHRTLLSPLGVRKDFQKVLAELRTDLDIFTDDESNALMACGYKMAVTAFKRDLGQFEELSVEPLEGNWPFKQMLQEVASTAPSTLDRRRLLELLHEGRNRRI